MENLEHWSAQQPSIDFAQRATAEILMQERSNLIVVPRWRKPTLLILAVAFISASAWGAVEAGRLLAARPSLNETPIAPSPRPNAQQIAVGNAVAKIPPDEPMDAAKRPAALKRHVGVVPPSTEVAPLPRPRVPAPRCDCGPGAIVCGCVE